MKQKSIYTSLLILIYILKVYGSLILNKFGLITDDTWCVIHYLGTCILYCGFLYLLKDKVNSFIYSLGMAIFVSRLFTQVCSNDCEYWYEMLSVITITSVIYLIKKVW